MSDYETRKGKIKLLAEGGELAEQMAKDALLTKGKENGSDYSESLFGEGWLALLRDELYDEYLVIDDSLYRFIENKRSDSFDSFCELTHNDDGTISFFSQFYNGGTCLEEMIEETLKKEKE